MQKIIAEFNQKQQTKEVPELKAGDLVRVYRKIKEGEKERVQIFEGMVIAIKGGQSSSPMVTVRKISEGVGVEIILPIYSPKVEKIEILKRAKVRKSKLYYFRGLTAKESRMKNKDSEDVASQPEEKSKTEGKTVQATPAKKVVADKK
ncbi:MAG: 50S ribosomal protein L19 [Candidatus Moranbacteria bacterium CG10_big_fil_rev_8_21_14_0_10_35_21]|nr:MAG: 50S ribosomal protein L19 [Candidatus Moranbacteria bacterium CG10_big_fil_rev_8_21_14_0_10_35_21]PJA88347.1 MAG: 50S ribosomal protein L19 [Candidatus Moranbacteria bacterium CG_4_9_14_3_um_filter_36_9]